jgi:hypothetical protein
LADSHADQAANFHAHADFHAATYTGTYSYTNQRTQADGNSYTNGDIATHS